MTPTTINALTDLAKTLGTLVAICWCVSRLLTYWTARLAYFGAEPMPGIAGATRKTSEDPQ